MNNLIKIENLEWDSNLFQLSIGKIEIKDKVSCNIFLNSNLIEKESFDLFYIFDYLCNENLISKFNKNIVDEKITYCQTLKNDSIYIPDENISSILNTPLIDKILDLAFQSGEFSRFRIDPKIGIDNFEKLYKIWIENSLNGNNAFEVLSYIENNEILGIITLGIKNNIGDIGLLAVDTNTRGKSIGSKLLEFAFSIFQEKNINEVQVVTQKNNKIACNFYLKNNFKFQSQVNIYHIWQNK